MNYSKARMLRSNWIRLVRSIKPTREITFNFGTTLTPEMAASKMEALCQRIEDIAFGRNWNNTNGLSF